MSTTIGCAPPASMEGDLLLFVTGRYRTIVVKP
jgi:hypothetical protein